MSVLITRVSLNALRWTKFKNLNSKTFSVFAPVKNSLFSTINNSAATCKNVLSKNIVNDAIQPTMPLDNKTIPLKKKIVHKKAVIENLSKKEGHYLTFAYATAHAYDLTALREALEQQKLYQPGRLKSEDVDDVVVASAVYSLGTEPREILFFREGAVVFWNCTEVEANNVLEFIKPFEIESYPKNVVKKEREMMTYFYQSNAFESDLDHLLFRNVHGFPRDSYTHDMYSLGKQKRCNLAEESFVLVPNGDNSLEKYTFSHAMVQSARLGAWEERLESLAADIRGHAVLMETQGAAYVDKKEIVRKLGELFSLRHRLNVESDLLDTPDFYWEEEQLEKLYSNTVAYFTIPRRTRVLNERLSHCVELLELLSSWAADRHHVRLEWMVIALILAEVCFELLHCFERYVIDKPPLEA